MIRRTIPFLRIKSKRRGNLTLQKNSGGFRGKKRRFAVAQGIEVPTLSRKAFFAAGKKDTSGKPGFRCLAPEMRPFIFIF
jgi:hypothetical protein